jgi:hypothetical protein
VRPGATKVARGFAGSTGLACASCGTTCQRLPRTRSVTPSAEVRRRNVVGGAELAVGAPGRHPSCTRIFRRIAITETSDLHSQWVEPPIAIVRFR